MHERRQRRPNKMGPEFKGKARLARTLLRYPTNKLFYFPLFYIAFSDIPESND